MKHKQTKKEQTCFCFHRFSNSDSSQWRRSLLWQYILILEFCNSVIHLLYSLSLHLLYRKHHIPFWISFPSTKTSSSASMKDSCWSLNLITKRKLQMSPYLESSLICMTSSKFKLCKRMWDILRRPCSIVCIPLLRALRNTSKTIKANQSAGELTSNNLAKQHLKTNLSTKGLPKGKTYLINYLPNPETRTQWAKRRA